ncbi:virulence RhuM family protein [Dyadobacter jiangsuensis]|uniref:Virulence RhuM family protein n=1 Tax=Dyadobacter jiangsuensis TaxID=1591085 RepID=A0A2P8G7Z4_9BACT|nr:RhuM family protein [Dyadobacter jiangsuensis]PSL30087.1 virulence RhuM family protein [Dyadobacter jiangsuensis]
MDSKIKIYGGSDGEAFTDVVFEQDTVWLTNSQLVTLFDSSKANISQHIKHIFLSDELDEIGTVRIFRTVQQEGNRLVERNRIHYNLDVIIIAVGYRVNSKLGTQFRQWATQRLKDFLVKGYAINEARIKQKQ